MRLTRHHLLIIGAVFAFALMAVFTRRADAPFLTVAAWRAVVVALVFGVAAVASSPARYAALRPDRTTLRLGVVYGLVLAVASSTFVGGYAFTTVANTIFLHNLAPVAAFPLAWWFFREKPISGALSGAALAIIGVGLLSGVSLFATSHFANPRFLFGDFLSIVSALGYAGVLVATRATRRAETPILTTLFVAWGVAALVLLAIALVSGQIAIPLRSMPWVIGLAVVSTNLPFYLLNLGMRQVPAGLASVMSMAEVVFATLLGWLVFGEVLSPLGWLGGFLVVAGVFYTLSSQVVETQDESTVVGDEPSSAVPGARWVRLGLWLMVLNGAAITVLVTGRQPGVLLAWVALLAIVRIAHAPLRSMIGSRWGGLSRWTSLAITAGLMFAVALRGGWASGEISGWVVVLALAAAFSDHLLSSQEPSEDRDSNRLIRVALGLVVIAQLMRLMDHVAGILLMALAAGVAVIMAWGLVLDGLARRFPLSPTSTSTRMEAFTAWFLVPSRLLPTAGFFYLVGGFHVVPIGSQAIVERLGVPLPVPSEPGLLVRLPPPFEKVILVDTGSVRRLDLVDSSAPLLCIDHSLISVQAAMQFRVRQAFDYTYNAADPEAELRMIGRSTLMETVSHLEQDTVLTDGRAQVEEKVLATTQSLADQMGLGVEVLAVHLATVTVPAPVVASFLDVISADEERRTRINEAEAYAAKVRPEAFGQAVARAEAAKGEAQRIAARSRGEQLLQQALLVEGSDQAIMRARLRLEALEQILRDRPLLLAPRDRRIWIGEGASPLEPMKIEAVGSH